MTGIIQHLVICYKELLNKSTYFYMSRYAAKIINLFTMPCNKKQIKTGSNFYCFKNDILDWFSPEYRWEHTADEAAS